jgi:hypothetical protein
VSGELMSNEQNTKAKQKNDFGRFFVNPAKK